MQKNNLLVILSFVLCIASQPAEAKFISPAQFGSANQLIMISAANNYENIDSEARKILLKNPYPYINPKVLKLALKAYHNADKLGVHYHKGILTIIDYSKPSTAKRLWIVDLNKNKILYNTLVGHGMNSGNFYATRFSNSPNSLCSSLGLYLTKNVYQGRFGFSLRLEGLDKGFNDNALKRSVVMHGSKFVNDSLVKYYGNIAHSHGCPMISQQLARPIINTIKNGTLVFAYAPNTAYEVRSKFLHA